MHDKRHAYTHYLRGKGLEIGALNSPMELPENLEVLYSDIMSAEQIEEHYPGGKHPDIISDSESFPDIHDNSFDFIIANHVLEHLTDPIGAIHEWCRILRQDGIIYLAIPDKRFTFDRDRKRTTLEHLVNDHLNKDEPKYKNFDHLKDWATHVEKLEPNSERWNQWVEQQFNDGYSVHNHVWVISDILELIRYLITDCELNLELVNCNDTPRRDIEFMMILRLRKQGLNYVALRWVTAKLRYLEKFYHLKMRARELTHRS